jgi:hypothetical protein
MSKSITLQTSLSEVVANDVLGRISFAASNESSGSDAIRIGGSVTAVAESPFTEISNETSIYFSTASSEPAIPKLRISSKGHFAPLLNEVYDIGESGAKFRNLFVKNINTDSLKLNSVGEKFDILYVSDDNNTIDSTSLIKANTDISEVYIDGNITAYSGDYLYLDTDKIQFNTDTNGVLLKGQVGWNDTAGTLDVAISDTYALHIGQETYFRVRNGTGSNLFKGQAVYATGVFPDQTRLLIDKYVADGTVREVRFIGLITENISNNNNGFTTNFGYIKGLDTRGNVESPIAVGDETWSNGDILYVHPTVPGKLTKVEPKHSIITAIILRVHATEGLILVRPTSYGHIDDIHDVNTSGVTNGQFLQYNSATDYWVPSSSGNFEFLSSSGLIVNGNTTTNKLILGDLANKATIQYTQNVARTYTIPNAGANADFVLTAGNQTVGGVKTFNNQIVCNRANNTGTGVGQIYLNGATGNRIDFNTNGVAAPAFTTRSVGTKVVLFPAISATGVDYGFGIEASTMWSSVPNTTNQFRWYAGTTNIATLTGVGVFTVSGSTSQINVDNLRLDGNTLSVTNTNGNLIIAPNGTGALVASTTGNSRGANSVDLQTSRSNNAQVASGPHSVISGGRNNTASGYYGHSTVGGGCGNSAIGSDGYSTVSGGRSNSASGSYSTVGGGRGNSASDYYSTVSGGCNNSASATYSTVSGGCCNTASGNYSTISGGHDNTASGYYSTVSGGADNCASGNRSSVAGGSDNCASGSCSFVGGGTGNTSSGTYSTVSGGYANQSLCVSSTISGGYENKSCGCFSSVGGGCNNNVVGFSSTVSGGAFNSACSTNSSISGGCCNFVNARHGSINGGHRNVIQSPTNECCSRGATIGGGVGHNSSGGTVNSTTGDITGTVTCCNAGAFSTIGGGLRNIATGARSTVGGGDTNSASGSSSTVSGGVFNSASGNFSTVGGGDTNSASGSYSTVSGGFGHCASGSSSTISGGSFNCATATGSTVGGGGSLFGGRNIASASFSTVGGGYCNSASGSYSTVGGGQNNSASGVNSTVGGGNSNTSSGNCSTVGGGNNNNSSGFHSTISGGYSNTSSSSYASVGGGFGNTASASYSTVSGGYNNSVSAYSSFSTISGGYYNNVQTSSPYAYIGGGFLNSVSSYGVVGGGLNNTSSGFASTVSGGYSNVASSSGSTISGGKSNLITASASYSNISGGVSNSICSFISQISGGSQNFTNARYSSINGGHRNVIQSPTNECCSRGATIGGGIGHNTTGGTLNTTTGDLTTDTVTCCNAGAFSTIGGGLRNIATGAGSTVSGGGSNSASGTDSTVSGGYSNCASTIYSTVSGGRDNSASETSSTVSGGQNNSAIGTYSTISGGYGNSSQCTASTVSGGYENNSNSVFSTIAGGCNNRTCSTGTCSTISGGSNNTTSGAYATVTGGNTNSASGAASTVSGFANTASGFISTVVGGGFNFATGSYSTGAGFRSKPSKYGEFSNAAGMFASNGDAQHSILVARRQTTDATANQVLFLDGTSIRAIVPSQTAWAFTINLSAYNSTDNQAAWWIFRGGIRRNNANGTSLIGSVNTLNAAESSLSTASASVVADDTNEALEIRVTGVASKTIRWVATIDLTQVSAGTP